MMGLVVVFVLLLAIPTSNAFYTFTNIVPPQPFRNTITSSPYHPPHSRTTITPNTTPLFVSQPNSNNHNNSKRSSSSSSTKKHKKPKKRRSRRFKKQSTTTNPHSLQTWRFYSVSVSPDDLIDQPLYLNHPLRSRTIHRTPTGKASGDTAQRVGKMYLSQPVLDALLRRIKYSGYYRDDDDVTDGDVPMGGGTTIGTTTAVEEPKKITFPNGIQDVRIARRSLDARRRRRRRRRNNDNEEDDEDEDEGPLYSHVIDVDLTTELVNGLRLKHRPGWNEQMTYVKNGPSLPCHSVGGGLEKEEEEEEEGSTTQDTTTTTTDNTNPNSTTTNDNDNNETKKQQPTVVVVGAGPAGLFCALELARSGVCKTVLLERGQPVEARGRDIGALIHRRRMDRESNFAFGEGGAGTWSDGKLTTRIGRNDRSVRKVLETFVEYGAPEKILVDGSPHLGTDNLQVLLRNMRLDLRRAGVEIRFGARASKFHFDSSTNGITGVTVAHSPVYERGNTYSDEDAALQLLRQSGEKHNEETICADAVVLATGHSARDVYEDLYREGVELEAKGFAAGFRIEHPQSIINKICYGEEWGPRAYCGRLSTDTANTKFFASLKKQGGGVDGGDGDGTVDEESGNGADGTKPTAPTTQHEGKLPIASYRLATDEATDGTSRRGVYSFCMCPGGQVVPASTDPEEVCVNGMSFSKRDTLWANSGLVVAVTPDDPILEPYRAEHGVLAGLAFQRDMERRASVMGGGNFTVPVQRLTDFIEGVPSTTSPSSSYRIGVKPGACHEIYPPAIAASIRDAVVNHFDKKMPGYLCEEALLHGVETRTSSPVRVCRDPDTLQAVGKNGLFPAGEGAGFAGGIVSAAVDGMVVAEAVLENFSSIDGYADNDVVKREKKQREKPVGFTY